MTGARTRSHRDLAVLRKSMDLCRGRVPADSKLSRRRALRTNLPTHPGSRLHPANVESCSEIGHMIGKLRARPREAASE